MNYPLGWSDDQWNARIASPDWGPRVLNELQKLFEIRFHWLGSVTLISAGLEKDEGGVPVLVVIYDDTRWVKRVGLRRRLNRRPTAIFPDKSAEESTAIDIAMSDLSEPLGSIYEQLVPDEDGVWWWGDGLGS